MATYKASIHVTLRPSILDPQGKAARGALVHLGYESVEQVRMGKFIEMWINANDESAARVIAEEACEKLLANPVVENFDVSLEQSGVAA